MSRLWDREFAQSVDLLSSKDFAISSEELMERAGESCARIIAADLVTPKPILVLCGAGHNGGDGLVIARHLAKFGYDVSLCYPDIWQESLPEDELMQTQFQRVKETSTRLIPYNQIAQTAFVFSDIVVVDALLGIGFKGSLRSGPVKELLGFMLGEPKAYRTYAIDLPSAMDVNAESWFFSGVKADKTLTFGALKPCHVVNPLRGFCGEVQVLDIGFHPDAIRRSEEKYAPRFSLVPHQEYSHPYDELAPDSHKFDRGHILVLGGSQGKSGAPLLSALAALRSGAGWVSVALAEESRNIWPLELTEEFFFRGGCIDQESLRIFVKERKVKVIIVGPGTMTSPLDEAMGRYLQEFTYSGGRVCFDAGSLSGLIPLLSKFPLAKGCAVALPHPGEWTKLPGPVAQGLDEKFLSAWQTQEEETGVKYLFKSATPLFLKNNQLMVVVGGRRSLAKAGSGDVLAGIIGAYLATSLSLEDVLIRAFSSLYSSCHRAIRERGEHAVIATDLIEYL